MFLCYLPSLIEGISVFLHVACNILLYLIIELVILDDVEKYSLLYFDNKHTFCIDPERIKEPSSVFKLWVENLNLIPHYHGCIFPPYSSPRSICS